MKMASFSFHAAVEDLKKVLRGLKREEYSTKSTDSAWRSISDVTDSEKKSALDQAFREFLTIKLKESGMIVYF